MSLIGIRGIRRLALLALLAAVVLIAASCSSFNREWRKVGRTLMLPLALRSLGGELDQRGQSPSWKIAMYCGQRWGCLSGTFPREVSQDPQFGYTVALKAEVTAMAINSAVRRISA